MLDQTTLYPIADDVLFAPGGKVVIRTYGVAPAASGGSVSYRTWVTGIRDHPRYWRWGHFEDATRGHRSVLEWLTGRGPQPGQAQA
ncbi:MULTISPECIES: hypothetical protein [Nonomuraea]|jgi:hypothetical protein|uniref:Uncharacterized protein n=2 Tax=Nonomuraea TaxID=83681 RepID=A0ABW1BT11_9ACTN|nr:MULTISPECIES: hypothetical protein [Nonomuraea]MDA0641510.1 hypothetical protein [Nonomuraea ferruginea]TXK42125.1 hypothetical protein FR742_23415 [Nonomuraea sp. C10]